MDWFKFTYEGDGPKLVHLELDLLERDNIPVDVSVFTVENGEAKSYERGADPVTPPHEVQALPGNKFTTRIITRGTYYVRVDANHVFYQLRTAVYDAPPFSIQSEGQNGGKTGPARPSAPEWIIWSARATVGTPTRRVTAASSIAFRAFISKRSCIACHATHFTTRGELTAKQNGYAVNKRSPLNS